MAAWDGNETSEELIARADQVLYHAKDAGRDRILAAAQTASAPAAGAARVPASGPVVPQGDGVDRLLDAAGDQLLPGHVGQHPDGLVAQPHLRA